MKRHSGNRGFTAVELLMAISIFAIGVSGVIAMEKVTVKANQHAKELSIATHIGQAWLDELASDATRWNHPSPTNPTPDIGETDWLKNATDTGTNPPWFRPAWVAARNFGAAFDSLGNPLDDASAGDAVYCVHVRLSWLYPATAGNGLLRAEVRVFWLREGMGGTSNGKPVCDPGSDPTNVVEANGDNYHFVYQATAIRQNTSI